MFHGEQINQDQESCQISHDYEK